MKVLFLADSSPSTGAGHAVRSMVLAREMCELGHAVQVLGVGISNLSNEFESLRNIEAIECTHLFDSDERLRLIEDLRPSLVVIDGYSFDAKLFETLDDKGVPYGVVDDVGLTQATNPLFVLNPNPHALQRDYTSRFPEATVLAGLDYSLIRREILNFDQANKTFSQNDFALVSFGGTDVLNLTVDVVQALAEANFECKVALGAGVVAREKVINSLENLSRVEVIAQSEYEAVLGGSSVAVLSAGTSLWEAAAIGKPAVGVIVAENQIEPASAGVSQFTNMRVIDALSGSFSAMKIVEEVRDLWLSELQTGVSSKVNLLNGAQKAAQEISARFSH